MLSALPISLFARTEDHHLSRVVMNLRRALVDSYRRPRFIETVRGQGYRLIAPVELGPAAGDEIRRRLAKRKRDLVLRSLVVGLILFAVVALCYYYR